MSDDFRLAQQPKPIGRLTPAPGWYFQLHYYPNAFWRFWQWLLLGWRWERLDP